MVEEGEDERDLGVIVDHQSGMNQQCSAATRKTNAILGCIKRGIISGSHEIIILLYFALMRLHLEYCIQFHALRYKKDVEILQRIKATNIRGLAAKPYDEQLRQLSISRLMKRRAAAIRSHFPVLEGLPWRKQS